MNTFLKNGWIQKLIIAIIIVLLFNFIYPNYAFGVEWGGVLLSPIQALATIVGDAGMWVVHKVCYNTSEVMLIFADSWLEKTTQWVTGLAVGALVVAGAVGIAALTIVSGGAAITALPLVIAGLNAVIPAAIAGVAAATMTDYAWPDEVELPCFAISPFEIFSGVIPLLDVNFISPKEAKDYAINLDENGNVVAKPLESIATNIRSVVSSVYKAMQLLATVVLLSVLVYVAIRIMVSSTGKDKAKYKQMLVDWIVAVCLVFLLHYIMTFLLTLNDKFIDMLAIEASNTLEVTLKEPSSSIDDANQKKLFDAMKKPGAAAGEFVWPVNLVGYARIQAQLQAEEASDFSGTLSSLGYTLIYLCLVIYTFVFLFMYLKRVIYMAFLTMIAPLVAITYPIDKIKDGQAQAFNMWLKEYMFNLLMQPMHMLLYIILIGSAFEFASENLIYSLVAIGFLLPAEKFVRKMFGMDKASSAGEAGSFAAGALASQAIGKLSSLAAPKKDKEKKNSNSDSGDNKVRTQDNPELDSGNADAEQSNIRTNDNDDYWGDENHNNSDRNNNNSSEDTNDNDRDEVMERYRNDGFSQNAEGVYFNPWTDEYDEDYNPHDNKSYTGEQQIPESSQNESEQEILGDSQEIPEQEIPEQQMPEPRQNTQEQQAIRDELNAKWEKEEEAKNKATLGERYDSTKFGSSRAGKFLKGAGNVAMKAGQGVAKFRKTQVGRYMGKKFSGLPKQALRMYAGAMLAGTAGLVGLAAGIADGKTGTAWKYTAAGLGAGYAGGAGLADRAELSSKEMKKLKEVEDEYNKDKYGTSNQKEVKQLKAKEKKDKKFKKEHQSRFATLYGSQNADRYMEKAIELQNQGMTEQQIYQQIDKRHDVYEYLNNMSASERINKYGNEDIVGLEDGYMKYMDAGVTDRNIIDKAMQIEHTGVEYDGVNGRMHKGISREEGMAAAIENQKIEARYEQENAERQEKIARGEPVGRARTKQEIGDEYLHHKHSQNIQKARENGMDKDTAEAFANRSEAATEKLRSMI